MAIGFATAGLQIGLDAILVRPKRGFSLAQSQPNADQIFFIPQVTLKEVHNDALVITDHPVEFGSNVSDHAFKRPASVVLTYGWSNSPAPNLVTSIANMAAGQVGGSVAKLAGLAQSSISGYTVGNNQEGVLGTGPNDVYQVLLNLQSTKTLIDIFTGKRFYSNMLVESVDVETDIETENAMIAIIHCRQLIVANTSVVTLPASSQANPSATAADVQRGVQSLVQR